MAERVGILDTFGRLLDLTFDNGLPQRLCILMTELENSTATFPLKITILQLLAYLSNCNELAYSLEIQTCENILAKTAIAKIVDFINQPIATEVVGKELLSLSLEVRRQAFHTLGIFAANHIVGLETFLFQQGGLQIVLAQLVPNPTLPFDAFVNWCICMTFKNYTRPELFAKSAISLEAISFGISQAVMYQETDERSLSIAILTQSYILRNCSASTEIKGVLARIISLLNSTKPEVQASCLIAIRRTITQSDVLCLEALNAMVMPGLLNVLDNINTTVENKLDCLYIINSIILKGYIAVFFLVFRIMKRE